MSLLLTVNEPLRFCDIMNNPSDPFPQSKSRYVLRAVEKCVSSGLVLQENDKFKINWEKLNEIAVA